MAVRLTALRTGRALHFSNLIFLLLVLISLRDRVNPKAYGRKDFVNGSIHLIGSWTRDLPACIIVPWPLRYQVPPNAYNYTVIIWPRGTLYPQKLALTSPTSGGRSVGILRSLTQATEFVFLYSYYAEFTDRRTIESQIHMPLEDSTPDLSILLIEGIVWSARRHICFRLLYTCTLNFSAWVSIATVV
jgi:hypothetical protein